MSLAQFALPGMLAPLQNLWHWFLPASAQGKPGTDRLDPLTSAIAIDSIADKQACAGLAQHKQAGARRPLRIVRILEAGQTPAQVGRMVVSGRMADVCAELDRLAAREAALH